MLTNPNAIGADTNLQNANTDPMDRPIPGQSLTGEPGKYAWEQPPEFTDVDEAFVAVVAAVKQDKRSQKAYDEAIMLGMPLESISNTIAFGGFVEGKWSVDVAELLKPPLMAFLMLYAKEKELPFVPFNNNSSTLETPADNMSDFEFLATMSENNPEAHNTIKTGISTAGQELIRKQADKELMKNSFLQVQGPEENVDG